MKKFKFWLKLTFVFFELTETSAVWMLNGVDNMIGLGEIDLVLISDDLSLRLGLQRHFHNVSGFVIEETMGVSQPGNCTEKDTKKEKVKKCPRREAKIAELMNNGRHIPLKRDII